MARHRTPPAPTSSPPDEGGILSPKAITQLTSLSNQTIWRLRRQGAFPEPIRLSPGRIGWRRGDVERWLRDRESMIGPLRPSPNPRARRSRGPADGGPTVSTAADLRG